VALGEILKLAAIPNGEDIKGPWLAKYLLVSAADGYRAIFALPELSPSFTSGVVLLADRRDGKPLSATEGPLRLVVPGEKRQARWVRQVLSLTLRSAPPDDAPAKP
jgi:DMSO/TMAO reductase YedYZ molybdopterin-dependent catalytic subunit